MNVRVPRSFTLSPIARLAPFAVRGFGIYRSRRIYDAASYGTEHRAELRNARPRFEGLRGRALGHGFAPTSPEPLVTRAA
ncbi:hypothetical protein LMG24076_00528 [Trinickia soli]|nr:hypothetical protein LMG24076_00528 [Trinickia soli]